MSGLFYDTIELTKFTGRNTESVGEYEYFKSDLIGHGAFALVYKGNHKIKREQVVAIKCINKQKVGRANAILDKEIKILKELQHQNIVQLFDCLESAQSVYLVMEYCNGGDLADYLQAKGTLSEDTTRIFLQQIAAAMAVLQSKGVVHRDLKPQNLLLSYKGAKPKPHEITIKIADFGFARHLQGNTMAATLCGSPMYMAPEVITSKHYDAKADLWSIGTIIFQCLTGKAPFQANTPQELRSMYEKSRGLVPKIPPGTSGDLHNLLLGLLTKNIQQRISFADFFNHPFLSMKRKRQAVSSPVAVPSCNNIVDFSPVSSNNSDARFVIPTSPLLCQEESSADERALTLSTASSSSKEFEDFVMIDSPPADKCNIDRSSGVDFQQVGKSPVVCYRGRMNTSPYRATPSGGECQGSDRTKPSPSPIPVPTQARNYEKMEKRNSLSSCSPSSPAVVDSSPPVIEPQRRGRASGKMTAEFSTIMENPIGESGSTSQERLGNVSRALTVPDLVQYGKTRDNIIHRCQSSARLSDHMMRLMLANKQQALMLSPGKGLADTYLHCMAGYGEVATPPNSPVNNQELLRYNKKKNLLQPSQSITASGAKPASGSVVDVNKTRIEQTLSIEPEFNVLQFYCQLADAIEEVAKEHVLPVDPQFMPCSNISQSLASKQHISTTESSDKQKQTEQFLLYLRSLQLLATCLHTVRNRPGQMNEAMTKSLVDVNDRYKQTYRLCVKAKSRCEEHVDRCFSADKLLYQQAVADCKQSALSELYEGCIRECVRKYKRALIIFEGIILHATDPLDLQRLNKFKSSVTHRLKHLDKMWAGTLQA